MGQRAQTTAEFRLFTALTFFVAISAVAIVAYDIYLHPPNPRPAGTATIKISGTAHFQGDVGTLANTYTIEGRAPVTVKVPYRRADYVVADIEQSSGTVEIIRDDTGQTVQEGSNTLLMWKAPRKASP
jgi:hypothetical protein